MSDEKDLKWGLRPIPAEVYDLDRDNLQRKLKRDYPGARVVVRDLRGEDVGRRRDTVGRAA